MIEEPLWVSDNHPQIAFVEQGKLLGKNPPQLERLFQSSVNTLTQAIQSSETAFLIGDFNTGKTGILKRVINQELGQGIRMVVLDEAMRANGLFGFQFGNSRGSDFDVLYGLEEITSLTMKERGLDSRKSVSLVQQEIYDSKQNPLIWYSSQHQGDRVCFVIDEIEALFSNEFFNGTGDFAEGERRIRFLRSLSRINNVSLVATAHPSPFTITTLLEGINPEHTEYTLPLNRNEIIELANFQLQLSHSQIELNDDFIDMLCQISGGDLQVVTMAIASTLITLEATQQQVSRLDSRVIQWMEQKYGETWYLAKHLSRDQWMEVYQSNCASRAQKFQITDANQIIKATEINQEIPSNSLSTYGLWYGTLIKLLVETVPDQYRVVEEIVRNQFIISNLHHELQTSLQKYLEPIFYDEVTDKNLPMRLTLGKLFTHETPTIKIFTQDELISLQQLIQEKWVMELNRGSYAIDWQCPIGQAVLKSETTLNTIAYTMLEQLSFDEVDALWFLYKGRGHSYQPIHLKLEQHGFVVREGKRVAIRQDNWFVDHTLNLLDGHRSVTLNFRLEELEIDDFLHEVNTQRNGEFYASDIDATILERLETWKVVIRNGNYCRFNVEDPSVKELCDFWLA